MARRVSIRYEDELLFATVEVTVGGKRTIMDRFLLDTGSVSTVLSAAVAVSIGLAAKPDDEIRRIRGVGGSEWVYAKRLERIQVGEMRIDDFEIEVGAVEYGITMDGILGLDFLISCGAIMDLDKMRIAPGAKRKQDAVHR
jgi:predicted aspartyl protease